MTAIPTEYNGVLYRSKLEAKWAAYFDLCGAEFEYEPQAFDLGDGVRYLPDFCVKDVFSVHGSDRQSLEDYYKYEKFWFECKGVMSDYDAEKIRRFRASIMLEVAVAEGLNGEDYQITNCPFIILDKSPLKMFNIWNGNEGHRWDDDFNFRDIDYDEFPFIIAKPGGCNGLGLFGADSNYLCHMDYDSEKFAKRAESMFRWTPKRT